MQITAENKGKKSLTWERSLQSTLIWVGEAKPRARVYRAAIATVKHNDIYLY